MTKETIKLYGYQEEATTFVLDNIDKTHVLLAAAPNAGKTFMTAFIIKELISRGKRILCSVHGTNVLKRQFYDSVCDIVGIDEVSVYDTSNLSLYEPSKSVQIMIYQNTKQMGECVDLYGKFDYLVVDEAHKFYEGTDSMDEISYNYIDGNHLLLTGSPAIFKQRVDDGEIRGTYISASLIESVHSGQYDTDIELDIVSNDVHLTLEDYNQNGEVIEKSQNKLTNNIVVLESVLVGDFGKVIIYVKRINQADEIETYLNARGVINYTSHSQTDKDSSNIVKFKDGYTGIDNVVLIVVARATEGFDDPNVSIIDLTYTKNIDTLYQRYSRAIRKRTDAIDKRYIKVVPNNGNSADVYVHVMTAVLMLLKQEHYENFNGNNFSVPTFKPDVIKKPVGGVGSVKSYCAKKSHVTNDICDNTIIIKSEDKPVSVSDLVNNDDFNVSVKVDENVYEITSDSYDEWVDKLVGNDYVISIEKSNDKVDDCLLMETMLYSGAFFNTKDELYGLITRYATSNLRDVLRDVNSELMSPEETFQICVDNVLISEPKYTKHRKTNPNLNISSNPYLRHNGVNTSHEYWELVKYKLSVNILSPEETFQICLDNELTSEPKYTKHRKGSDLNLPSVPHTKHEGLKTSKEYWELIKEVLDVNYKFIPPEETFKICVENRLTTITLYNKYRERNPKLNLHANPYKKYGNVNTSKDYWKLVKDTLGINNDLLSPEETFKICINNELISRDNYIKYRKDNPKLNLHIAPYQKYDSVNTDAEYWKLVKNELGINQPTPEETFQICINNELISQGKFVKYRKVNSELKLFSNPHRKHEGVNSEKEYYQLVKDYIKDNPKKTRTYSPAYLGEFS